MKNNKIHIVPEVSIQQRLSDYLPSIFSSLATKSAVKKAIKAGHVFVNEKKANTATWIQVGQKIEYTSDNIQKPKQFELKLEISYEDEHLALINKPAGIIVSGNQFKTIENTLLYNLKPSTCEDALAWPRPVHRLDIGTTGLLLVAKTKEAQISLHEQFEKKAIKKYYNAIVIGKLEEEITISRIIENQNAETIVRPIEITQSISNEYLTLVEAEPKTGRTHQIRIHLSSIGHPIMGDKMYGNIGQHIKGKGIFLSAVKIKFEHPNSKKEIKISINTPQKFTSFLNREKRRFENVKDK